MFQNWFKGKKSDTISKAPTPLPEILPEIIFDLTDIFHKLHEAEGRKEGLTLNAGEVAELFDYIEYVSYLDSMARCKKR